MTDKPERPGRFSAARQGQARRRRRIGRHSPAADRGHDGEDRRILAKTPELLELSPAQSWRAGCQGGGTYRWPSTGAPRTGGPLGSLPDGVTTCQRKPGGTGDGAFRRQAWPSPRRRASWWAGSAVLPAVPRKLHGIEADLGGTAARHRANLQVTEDQHVARRETLPASVVRVGDVRGLDLRGTKPFHHGFGGPLAVDRVVNWRGSVCPRPGGSGDRAK